jgi:putative FmdB family regulatory protein
MPLYEYFCEDCQKDFTLLQSANVNKDKTVCPECHSNEVRHQFSTFSSKIQGRSPFAKQRPATEDDYPNKDIFKLPIPGLR